jgi:hypothetical protein
MGSLLSLIGGKVGNQNDTSFSWLSLYLDSLSQATIWWIRGDYP